MWIAKWHFRFCELPCCNPNLMQVRVTNTWCHYTCIIILIYCRSWLWGGTMTAISLFWSKNNNNNNYYPIHVFLHHKISHFVKHSIWEPFCSHACWIYFKSTYKLWLLGKFHYAIFFFFFWKLGIDFVFFVHTNMIGCCLHLWCY